MPDLCGDSEQFWSRTGGPRKIRLVALERFAAFGKFLSELAELVPSLQGVNEHFAGVLRYPIRLDPVLFRHQRRGKTKRARELVAAEKLPERFLPGEMTELAAARLTSLEEERGNELVGLVRNPKLTGLR